MKNSNGLSAWNLTRLPCTFLRWTHIETFISTQHKIIHLQKYTLIHAVALMWFLCKHFCFFGQLNKTNPKHNYNSYNYVNITYIHGATASNTCVFGDLHKIRCCNQLHVLYWTEWTLCNTCDVFQLGGPYIIIPSHHWPPPSYHDPLHGFFLVNDMPPPSKVPKGAKKMLNLLKQWKNNFPIYEIFSSLGLGRFCSQNS